jgi:rhodanese-related sulfurtransferase
MWKCLVAVAVCLATPATVLACDGTSSATAQNHAEKATQCNHGAMVEGPQLQRFTVAEVLQMKTAGKALVFDANGAETRSKVGVVPGAVLLTSAGDYDVAKELPKAKDTQLVFYCFNEMCGASHMAARRASSAGYTKVAVMPEGIKGWKAKGQSVSLPQT